MRRLAPVALALLLALLCGCTARPAPPVSETRELLNTVCTVTLYAPADARLAAEALELCAEYEALFSRTAEGSDIWRANHAGGARTEIDARTAELVGLALYFGALTDGLFDITIGRASALWDFGGAPSVPEEQALLAAAATVDYRLVELEGGALRLNDPGAWLDLGGIAKGYIADRLADFLREKGVSAAIIDLGGNIVTVGAKPDGSPWRVGVERPFSGRGEIIGSMPLGECSVVTSGIYERQFTENGVLYHHILDPATGLPARSDVVSATVVSLSSAVGDALTTALVVAGSARAEQLLSRADGILGAVLALDTGEIIVLGGIAFEPAD